MDLLGRMLEASVDGSFLFGFSMGGTSSGGVNVSHILFADDTLIFCELDPNQFVH